MINMMPQNTEQMAIPMIVPINKNILSSYPNILDKAATILPRDFFGSFCKPAPTLMMTPPSSLLIGPISRKVEIGSLNSLTARGFLALRSSYRRG